MTDFIQFGTTRAHYINWTSCSSSKTYYFILYPIDIRDKKTHSETTKKAAVKLS